MPPEIFSAESTRKFQPSIIRTLCCLLYVRLALLKEEEENVATMPLSSVCLYTQQQRPLVINYHVLAAMLLLLAAMRTRNTRRESDRL